MPCPHFVDAPRCRCLAVDDEVIPTIHERTQYCRGDYLRCPTFEERERKGSTISLRAYEALWFAPGCGDSIGA